MKLKPTLFILFVCAQFSAFAQPTWEVGNTTLTEYDLVTGTQLPWEILWGPDDHLWMTSRKGEVLRIDPATGSYTTVLQKNVMNGGNGEPGMLGMAMHPDGKLHPRSTWFIVQEHHGMEKNTSVHLTGTARPWSTKRYCSHWMQVGFTMGAVCWSYLTTLY